MRNSHYGVIPITNQELVTLRTGLAKIRREWDAFKCEYRARKAGFRPEEPRVPVGSPGAGEWTEELTGIGEGNAVVQLVAAKRSAAYCWNQMQIDMLLCSTVQPASRRAACRAQANERYGACLAGRQIPPLSY